MSTCISRHGEYGSHLPGEDRFICDRCFVFDEDAAMAALVATESQLAAAQAQLAEAEQANRNLLAGGKTWLERAEAAEARLEAVRAELAKAVENLDERWVHTWSAVVPLVRRDLSAALAALSAAPQPEPCEHPASFDGALRCPTCMQAIRAKSPQIDAVMRSIEEYRNAPSGTASSVPRHPVPPASDEPARCEHGQTEPHFLPIDQKPIRGGCPGPAASGTPETTA